MPWRTDEDSLRHSQLAHGKLGALWREVANETLKRSGDKGRTIREARAVMQPIYEQGSDSL